MFGARLIVLSAALLLPAVACAPSQDPVPMKVADRVEAQAIPFRLQDVRLLDSAYRSAMIRSEEYLLSLEPDRLLHTFRLNAGLPSSATPLGGWETPGIELRGHSLGHYLSGLAIMYAGTGDSRFKARADAVTAELAKIQDAAAKRFNPGYLSAFPEEFFDRVEAQQRVWAPYYTIHKIMAGLLDVLKKQAAWVRFRMDRLTTEQQQRTLRREFGGMNEVLANLYAVTGDPEWLRVARLFDHQVVFEPLARGEDPLTALHANTQIPKMIGAAREYELTGDPRYRDIATFFWKRVVSQRSYAIGGNSDNEAFFAPEEFSRHLGASSAETCNTYNMLKLTRHLFAWSASAETMDYYERAVMNHILPSQDPKTGMVIYYCPLRPAAFKMYSTPNDSFWCCVGTAMESHGKYTDTIYFRGSDDRSLFVNLFIPSELTWSAKRLKVRQETNFPSEDTTRLRITVDAPARLALKVRYPSWAGPMQLTVNGQRTPVTATPGSYVTIDREWKTGDTVSVKLPMSLRTESTPDNPKLVALMYGPLVLAADLGTDSIRDVHRYGQSVPPMGRVPALDVPAFVAGDMRDLTAHIRPVNGQPLTFRTTGLGRPSDVRLVPFNTIFEPRYNVYWHIYTPAEWERRRTDEGADAARRKEFDRRLTDRVDVSSDESEKAHNFQGTGTSTGRMDKLRWRDAAGSFSYDLAIAPGKPVTLVCTFRGSEGLDRQFDILVDGESVGTERWNPHPVDPLDRDYKLPERLTSGKTKITVSFQPQNGSRTGTVLEVRTIQ